MRGGVPADARRLISVNFAPLSRSVPAPAELGRDRGG